MLSLISLRTAKWKVEGLYSGLWRQLMMHARKFLTSLYQDVCRPLVLMEMLSLRLLSL